jgi:hypothetical protein
MKLIEYKPYLGETITIDVENLPKDYEERLLNAFRRQPIMFITAHDPISKQSIQNINPNNKWVHPDYRVPEESNPSEWIEDHIKTYPVLPDSMNGSSLNHLWYEFPDPEGLNNISYETWEAAKPKLSEGLKAQLKKAPIIYGITGGINESRVNHNKQVHESYLQMQINDEVMILFDYSDIMYLSESPEQAADWMKRKKRNLNLTAKDLMWVDKMVDTIFDKHASCKPRTNYGFFIPEKFNPGITIDKFMGPLW